MQSFEISPGYISWPAAERVLGEDTTKKSVVETIVVASIVTALAALAIVPLAVHSSYKTRRRRAH